MHEPKVFDQSDSGESDEEDNGVAPPQDIWDYDIVLSEEMKVEITLNKDNLL